jgi:O-antigen/teichoic acid export membrane protein
MLKNIFQSLLTKGGVAIVNFLVLILSSRYLGVSSRGEISIFILNIAIVQTVAGVYTGYSLIHYVPLFNLRRLILHGVLFTVLFTTIINTVFMFLNKQVPGYNFFGYIISLLVILNTFNCILLLGLEDIKMFNRLSILQPALLLIGITVFVLIFRIGTFEAYVFPLFISFCIAFVISTFILIQRVKKQDKDQKPFELGRILSDGVYYQAGLLMYMLINRFCYYLLPQRADVGLYSSAVVFTESVLIVANGIAPVIMAEVANQDSKTQSVNLSISLSKLSFVLSLIGIVLILFIPESLFIAILGPGFGGIKTLILAYSPGVLAASAFIPLTGYFSAQAQQKTNLVAYALGFIITVGGAPFLVHLLGTSGAALTADIAYGVIAVVLALVFTFQNKVRFSRWLDWREDYANLQNYISKKRTT